MNLKYFFVLFYFLGFNFSLAQKPIIKQWDKRFGGDFVERSTCIQQTADGGYILGGQSSSDSSGDKTQNSWFSQDYWIVKIDSIGNKQWDKRYGGDSWDYFFSVQQTSDMGYIIGGSSVSGVSGDKTQPHWGSFDFWIVKTDSLGNKQWDKRYGGLQDEFLGNMIQTKDGGYLLAGSSRSNIGGNKSQPYFGGTSDYWIIKVNAQGVKQWDKDFGGTSDDALNSIKETKDGGYIIGGSSNSDSSGNKSQNIWHIPFTPMEFDYWIVKIDSLGNKQWDKDYGGTRNDDFGSLELTDDGGYILAGTSNSGISGNKTQPVIGNVNKKDYWIVKIDSVGNFQWDKDFGGNDEEIELWNIVQTSDKGFLMSGTSESQMSGHKTENNLGVQQTWVVKTDSLGNKQWDKTPQTYNTMQYTNSWALETNEGCYVMANNNDGGIGGDKTQPSWGYGDYWMIKYCNNPVKLTSSDTTFCGKQYIDFYDHSTNNPTSWQWFFPGGLPASSTQQNPTGIYYNSFGSFDVTLIACNGIICDTLILPNFINELPNPPAPVVTWIVDTLFSTPAYAYQWYFNSNIIPGATGQYYVFQQPGDYFVIITDSNGCSAPSFVVYTGFEEINGNQEITISPNPSNGNFIIYGTPYNATFNLYEVNGRSVFSGKLNSTVSKVQFKTPDGVYFLEVTSKNKVFREKIMIKN